MLLEAKKGNMGIVVRIWRRLSLRVRLVLLVCITTVFLVCLIIPTPLFAADGNPYLVRTFFDDQGRQIDEVVVPGRPPEVKAEVAIVPEPHVAMGINALSNVPALDWSYGCSATSAAMMAGYYDRTGYSDMYTGPTNGGVFPLPTDDSIWGSTYWPGGTQPVTCMECPLSATHDDVDGRSIYGHVDDYWTGYGNYNDDPFDGNWTEHSYGDCTADYMGTNQDYWNNSDGGTTFYYYSNGAPISDYTGDEGRPPPLRKRDGCHGLRLFLESRGYTVTQNYNQYIYGYEGNTLGFTFSQFQSEIDAGRTVLIHLEGHTMLGYGYNTTGNLIYIHDTWDYDNHSMTWGGTHGGYQHMGVTVIQLQSPGAQSWYLHDDGVMYRGVTDKAEGSVEIGAGGSNVWIADEAATVDVGFPSAAWTGQVVFTSAPSAGPPAHTFTIDIGNADSDGSDFQEGGPDATLTGDGSATAFTYTTDAASFTVPNTKYLAFRITNNSGSGYNVTTGEAWSYINSPSSDPGYPVPELGTIILLASGLTVLAGYAWFKRRSKVREDS